MFRLEVRQEWALGAFPLHPELSLGDASHEGARVVLVVDDSNVLTHFQVEGCVQTHPTGAGVNELSIRRRLADDDLAGKIHAKAFVRANVVGEGTWKTFFVAWRGPSARRANLWSVRA